MDYIIFSYPPSHCLSLFLDFLPLMRGGMLNERPFSFRLKMPRNLCVVEGSSHFLFCYCCFLPSFFLPSYTCLVSSYGNSSGWSFSYSLVISFDPSTSIFSPPMSSIFLAFPFTWFEFEISLLPTLPPNFIILRSSSPLKNGILHGCVVLD